MEPIFLSHVEATIALQGRGIAIEPGVPYEPKTHRVWIGDALEIRAKDGSRFVTKVSGLDLGGWPGKKSCPIVLPPEVKEEDIPIGAEVWQLSQSLKPK